MNRIASAEQLGRAIAKRLPPITWVSGDEPLLVLEAADAVRAQARTLGYGERTVIDVGPHFDVSLLLGAAQALSLFASRRLVDVRLAGKPSRELGEALQRSAQAIDEDSRILVTSGRLERATVNTAWFGAFGSAFECQTFSAGVVEPFLGFSPLAMPSRSRPVETDLVKRSVEQKLNLMLANADAPSPRILNASDDELTRLFGVL